jgi:hypothetical protein
MLDFVYKEVCLLSSKMILLYWVLAREART